MYWTIVAESDIHHRLDQAIRELLVAAYPQRASFFAAHSYWGAVPEFRLLCLVDVEQPVAHLEFGRRDILVGNMPVRVAGIGAVAVHPELQGNGLGGAMFAELRRYLCDWAQVDFGLLQCREEVVGFYEQAGLVRMCQPVHEFNPDTQTWTTDNGPVMVLPALKSVEQWPSTGTIHLNGLPW